MAEGDSTQVSQRRLLIEPARWPVRWRLAIVSALLTLVILFGFAAIVGRLAADRLRDDFQDELRSAAGELAFEISVGARESEPFQGGQPVTPGEATQILRTRDLERVALAEDADIRVVSETGQVLEETAGAPELGPLRPGVTRVGDLQVATAPVVTTEVGLPATYVQYARDRSELEDTINRLWLFLAGGALVGTVLAALAGLAVANRAMNPIASLTAVAREIATTRDPSRRMPNPETDDEVAELARTLEQMLRELDAARSETQQAMQAQREFVADASHELRTPLTSVLANLELLQEALARTDGRGEESEAVESALRSSQRMSRLVSDLLLLARADAGKAGPRTACDLAEIASDALAEVEPVAGSRRLELQRNGPVPVRGNPDELHRMVLNLLDNAVRHTPEETHVLLRIERGDADAVLEVSDDGPGFPPGSRDQLFRRFVRGGGPADRAGNNAGTGLGLAIVRAVAVSHHGDVEAGRSARGGARFTVRLPLLREAAKRSRTPA